MYDNDPNWCPVCGLPFTPTEERFEISGIGDEFTHWETITHDDLCQCADEDDDD